MVTPPPDEDKDAGSDDKDEGVEGQRRDDDEALSLSLPPICLQCVDTDGWQWQCPHQTRTRMWGQMMMMRVQGDDDKTTTRLSLSPSPPICLQCMDADRE